MFGRETILNKVAGGGGCTDIVDNYDPFEGSGVALYQLNGDATDESTNYDGTWSGTAAYTTGVFGQSANLSGSNYITMSGLTSFFTPKQTFTVSLWFKTSGSNVSRYLFSDEVFSFTNNYNITISQGASGFLSVATVYGGVVTYYNTTTTYKDNAWHNIVVTINQSNQTGNVYIDGAFIGSYTLSTGTKTGTPYPVIGTTGNAYLPFIGQIDQVRIFNEALTPLEVEALYTEELCICDGTVDTLDILGDGSCIATYQLDGNANDLSGNYSGTPTNVSYGVGEFDLAGVFNGSSSYINLPLKPIYDGRNNITTSFWFNVSDSGRGVLFTDYAGSNDWNLIVSINRISVGDIYIETRYGGNNAANQITGTYSDGAWHCITIVLNQSTNQRITYIDNILKETTAISSASWTGVSTQRVTIGDLYNTNTSSYQGTYALDGQIDQVRIFNKALSSSEVTTLYNETACTKITRTAGATQILGDSSCVAYYKLDGDVTDETGTYDGSVVGTISYADGDFNYAADFDYSNNYINTNFPLLWDNVQGNITPITVSCWIKGQGYSGTGAGYILMSGYFARIIKLNTGQIQISMFNQFGGYLAVFVSPLSLENTDWHHIVGVFNYKTVKLYIDNQFIGEDTGTDGFSGDQQITKNMLIGKWNLTSQNAGYLGQIDQFRVFNKEVSAGEVTTLYNEGI